MIQRICLRLGATTPRTVVSVTSAMATRRRTFEARRGLRSFLAGPCLCPRHLNGMPRVQALEAAVRTNEGNIASLTMSATPNRRAVLTGEAMQAYVGHLPDAAIEAMLNELAADLGAALGQERIDVAFAEQTWTLDAGERESGD